MLTTGNHKLRPYREFTTDLQTFRASNDEQQNESMDIVSVHLLILHHVRAHTDQSSFPVPLARR